ncbi:respiratory-chain NADH dehydrogenase, 49 Kd subunit [Mycobacterium kansasii 732]|uniref:Formate hydrogenlyase subunit 5 n=1 Tax=Mycobacterium pseudokansasii TaxID=2341080 RepID=A0A498QT38_9MYCO|nr:NADH-quinone oxidoreductase subunit C [Mycobacterium pseudokansasii]EUA11599.1 respiratory-chain NADH dehydrogenase, 49 Kd subunit [Mycobacterium kansasii 732]MBY0391135.1 NADH-quinone oxidoreductase subunit C [Mycobacterium pseudokansasii]VBA53833.1 Formate hydrogenlyase subunit 5 [Mycobacterium pseudokansasii]
MTTAATMEVRLPLPEWRAEVLTRLGVSARFGGLYCTHQDEDAQLRALLITRSGVECLSAELRPGADGGLTYPALTPDVPVAFWYERALHDLSGVIPLGHPRLDPLLLPWEPGQLHPRPGHREPAGEVPASDRQGPVDVTGHGVFTLPLGPVRSGVYESIEFLIETPGEDVPHFNIRPHYKHRGIAKRFEGLGVGDAILIAERVEGIASVAHALAFAHAVETLADTEIPPRAELIRVIHAELERIANHLDVVVRLCDAAGLAIGNARFGWHKERIMRLVSRLCGNRFGRSVVCVGGVSAPPRMSPPALYAAIDDLAHRLRADRRALMESPSFLDRIRGTGRLDGKLAASHGALGPVGRGSGFDDDARLHRPYDGYSELPAVEPAAVTDGDAMARLRVRWAEIDTAVGLIEHACQRLSGPVDQDLTVPVDAHDGFATGWAESPQGEILYGLDLREGRVGRCFARTPSLHNMVLFHDVFHGDVFTDFPFIEASFGLCYAGVAM